MRHWNILTSFKVSEETKIWFIFQLFSALAKYLYSLHIYSDCTSITFDSSPNKVENRNHVCFSVQQYKLYIFLCLSKTTTMFSYNQCTMAGLCYQGKWMFIVCHVKNDSNRGSVRSTISSSDACQFSPFDVKRIKLFIYSVETVSTSLSSFPTQRLWWSIPSGKELQAGNLLDGACLCFSACSGSFTQSDKQDIQQTKT